MSLREIPLAFECQGETLIGIVHRPEQPARRGVLALVAGGPQYRAGCCRQLVYMARDLAANGIPVMRFDYRGMGDGGGDFRGFQYVEQDLATALRAFAEAMPGLEEVVLWGGCDAASAILIHGHKFPIVSGMVLGNPFARTELSTAAAKRQYYLQRLRDKAFWAKVFKLRFNPFKAARAAVNSQDANKPKATHATVQGQRPFTERMLQGLQQFRGRILLVMSGQSLTSQAFDVLISTSPAWKKALQARDVTRADLPNADQAFSTVEARDALIAAARRWLEA